MQYFAILTMALGAETITVTSNLTVGPDAVRAEVLAYMRDDVVRTHGSWWQRATVLFFSVEPNKLG